MADMQQKVVDPIHLEDSSARANQLGSHEEYGTKGLAGITRSPYVFCAAFLAALGSFSFGYDQGVITLVLVMPQFQAAITEVQPTDPHYGFHTGFLTGMLLLGAFVGCLFFPMLADRYSRKRAIAVAAVLFNAGAVIQTTSHSYAMLVAGRTVGGLGLGTLAMGAPLYIAEVAPPHLRGSLLVLEAISIVVGAVIAYWITYGTREIAGDWAFRLPFLLQVVPATVVGAGIQFFPYSPRWLAMVHRDEDSLQALVRLRRLPAEDARVQREWRGMLREVAVQEAAVGQIVVKTNPIVLELRQWGALFSSRYMRRTAIALAIPFFQQFSGINAFVYYAPTFFAALGLDYEMTLILSGLVNVVQLIGGIPTFLFLDRMGRRKLAIWGAVAMGVPHMIMAGLVRTYGDAWAAHAGVGRFGVALIYLYVLAYGAAYNPLTWTLPAEVFPNSRRAKGVGVAMCMEWMANFVIGICVPEMQLQMGWGTYLFFGFFCFLAAVFCYFFVPETAGKSLEQIAAAFGDRVDDGERELESASE